MILRSAPASPFGRKCKIAAALLGLSLSVVEADTTSPTDSLRRENPLGKIPTLILDDGTTLFDSSVIVAYLDAVSSEKDGAQASGGRLIPAETGPRFAALRLEALADGLADAALLQVYEGRWRAADRHDAAWVDHQAGKVERALAALEAAPPPSPTAGGSTTGGSTTVGSIALACALGYLDLRFGGRWRDGHPALVAWLDAFAAAVPSFEATRVKAA